VAEKAGERGEGRTESRVACGTTHPAAELRSTTGLAESLIKENHGAKIASMSDDAACGLVYR
jgi:hypothetical protein